MHTHLPALAHRVSRPRGTGSVGDSVGEGAQETERAREREEEEVHTQKERGGRGGEKGHTRSGRETYYYYYYFIISIL